MATGSLAVRPPLSRSYLLICLAFFAVALTGASALLWLRTVQQAYFLVVLFVFAALVAAVTGHRWWRGQLDWFEPGILLPPLYLLSFGLGGLRLLIAPDDLHPFLQNDQAFMTLALLYVLLGVTSFWFGYYGRFGLSLHEMTQRPARELPRSQAVIRRGVVLALYFGGLASRLLMLRLGLYGYLKNPDPYGGVPYAEALLRIQDCCNYALVLAWLDRYSHPDDPRRRLVALSLLVSELAWGFFSGMKTNVLLPLLLVTIVFTYKRRRLPLKLIAVAVLVFVLIYPVNTIYRQMFRSGQIQIQTPLDLVANSSYLAEKLLSQFDDPNLYLASGYESVLTRASMIENYALLLKYLDNTGAYWHGRYLWMLPALILVPRAVWPTKPVSNTGYWFAVNVWGQDPHILSSVAITQVGDLHLQFGLPSVLVGMFVIGVVLRFFYERFGRPASNYSLFFYILVLAGLMRIDEDITFLTSSLLRLFVILFVLSFLVFKFPRPTYARSQHAFGSDSAHP